MHIDETRPNYDDCPSSIESVVAALVIALLFAWLAYEGVGMLLRVLDFDPLAQELAALIALIGSFLSVRLMQYKPRLIDVED